jgi:hypothetical protein
MHLEYLKWLDMKQLKSVMGPLTGLLYKLGWVKNLSHQQQVSIMLWKCFAQVVLAAELQYHHYIAHLFSQWLSWGPNQQTSVVDSGLLIG